MSGEESEVREREHFPHVGRIEEKKSSSLGIDMRG